MIISKGNMKIGKIPNISLTPLASCGICTEHCGLDCYAMKAYRRYPAVREAWDHNLHAFTSDPAQYFEDIHTALSKYKGKFFRWHVGGDIPTFNYFNGIVAIARRLPDIKFLLFTKQYRIVNLWLTNTVPGYEEHIPSNLQIVFSAWPSLDMSNPYQFPVAYMQDGTETRLTGEEIECPGSCEACGMCWSLGGLNKNVVFHKH